MPVYVCVLEKDVSDRIEVMVTWNHHKLNVRKRCSPFAKAFVDPLLLIVDVPCAATAQRRDIAGENNNIRTCWIKPLKVAMQV